MKEQGENERSEAADMPEPFLPTVFPTLNGRGFMFDTLDPFSAAFVDDAARADGQVLDMGCAYGVATLPALARGAHVVACDMEQGHLDVLVRRVPEDQRRRLTVKAATLPDVDFDGETFAAILSSRMFHFLTGDEIERSVRKMFNWLKPGAKLFLIADTPYMAPWNKLASTYEDKKRRGDPWPGFIADYRPFMLEDEKAEKQSPHMNPLDPDILSRVCMESGFTIERTAFFGLQREGAKSNGNEHAGCIAVKPVS